MPRFAACIAYDGTAFAGWQTQPGGRTVQDALEAALAAVAAAPVATVCAGRTDAGVHAIAQVVHFDTEAERPLRSWVRGVNAHLPPEVAATGAWVVPEAFDARRSAQARRYDYLIHCAPDRHPLAAGRAAWEFRPVDDARLAQAARCLLGEHDFSAFRSSQCEAPSPVRRLDAVEVHRDGPWLRLRFVGNAFLHHMVRNLVGSLLMVGTGRRPPEWLAEVLAGRDRSRAAATHAPQGLYLTGVRYAPQYDLPSWPQDVVLRPF